MMMKLDNLNDLLRLEYVKSKDAKNLSVNPFGLVRTRHGFWIDTKFFPTRYLKLLPVTLQIHGKEVESLVVEEAKDVDQSDFDPLTRNQQKVLECLLMEIFADGADYSEIATTTEIKLGSLQPALPYLLRHDLVSQTAKREPYVITSKGKERMTRLTRIPGRLETEIKHPRESCR